MRVVRWQVFSREVEVGFIAPRARLHLCRLLQRLRHVRLSEPRAILHANRCRFVSFVVAAVF